MSQPSHRKLEKRHAVSLDSNRLEELPDHTTILVAPARAEENRVAYLPVEPVMQAAYAEKQGFFTRQGIDAELKVVADPSLIPAAILSGEVQFAAFNIGGLANLRARNLPVKLIAAGALYRPEAPTTALLGAPGKTITGARDRKLRTIRAGVGRLSAAPAPWTQWPPGVPGTGAPK